MDFSLAIFELHHFSCCKKLEVERSAKWKFMNESYESPEIFNGKTLCSMYVGTVFFNYPDMKNRKAILIKFLSKSTRSSLRYLYDWNVCVSIYIPV